ncbi:MAG: glycolate oxidase subunit GlcF [Gallionella sp.]|nr:glycolate oxidase subunit GlcF [Gallionella sp.]
MQTTLTPLQMEAPDIAEANAILRSCVHCGFCTATCPTYQLLGSELDGPRGRIYLIKDMLESGTATDKTRLHLDRCLTCRACETTCPSGVQYGRLIDIGRELVEEHAPRPLHQTLMRKALLRVLPYPARLKVALALGRLFKPLLPKRLASKIPAQQSALPPLAASSHARHMLVLEGCVQPLSTPNTNAAAARVLDRFGIALINAPAAGCCGALNQHLSDSAGARDMMRNNIDAWWPYVERGAEAIVMSASGCGLMVKGYGAALRDDAKYAEKAARISALALDLVEVLSREDLSAFAHIGQGLRVAYHSSCTLQHGQKLGGTVESLLRSCGFELTDVANSHLCCGAAGTYTLTQPELSEQLLGNKITALEAGQPEVIVTANVGCQMHLASAGKVPVRHWIELLAAH